MKCLHCRRTGAVVGLHRSGDTGGRMKTTCLECDGKGDTIERSLDGVTWQRYRCRWCDGDGTVIVETPEDTDSVEVETPQEAA